MIRDKVFISYSHKDKKWLDQILLHLKPLIREGLKIWSDQDIPPGQPWPVEIEHSLNTANVAVLLVSAEFLASDFIQEKEVPRFLHPAKLGQITILPVLISACAWDATEIGDFQSPIDFRKPLKDLRGNKRDEALVAIAQAIKAAWEKPSCSQSLPEDDQSRMALSEFRKLAAQHAAMSAEMVEACFLRALRELPGNRSKEELFPQLTTTQTLGWPQLNDFFNDACRPDPALVQALERQLNAPVPQPLNPPESNSYIALVLQWSGSRDQDTSYYTWSAFVAQDVTDDYQEPLNLEGLEQSRDKVVFGAPLVDEDEIGIATILAQLYSWANCNTSLPVLEIFAPAELLDAPWSELVVEQRPEFTRTLLKAIPFLLRPVDRLEESLNSNRKRLQKKIQMLREGKGRWCAEDLAANTDHLLAAVVEEDQDAGIKRLQPFPLDQTKRDAWFVALIESMVPIAIWWSHGTSSCDDERTKHLTMYEMLAGHRHRDPICATCVRYDDLTRQRKKLITDPLASQLVFMLDHWERTPKITPQARGATRATSPASS
jgi:hypothetical protein